MQLFLPKKVWQNNKGFSYGKPVTYLSIGYHAGQDFHSNPVGEIPVIAPCDGVLTTFPFSTSAGWWGFYKFDYLGTIYSLKILHMYKEMKAGEYKEGDILGYCGATGLSVKNGRSFNIGPSHEDQTSDGAVPHLHAELHLGEFKHDTNRNKDLAKKRIIDPVTQFEKWVTEKPIDKNDMTFYKERGRSSVYIKGTDNVFYPIIMGKHFLILFGDWENNKIIELDTIDQKSNIYFGLFKSNNEGNYETA